MTVCAGMLVKDEADIVEYAVGYLLTQVDHVIVYDNGSTDGTREKLLGFSDAVLTNVSSGGGYTSTPPARGLWVRDDPSVAYYQAEKMTALAALALALGHQWFVPVDADEFWYATDGRTVREFLGGLAPDVAYVEAPLFNHLPTSLDPPAICESCENVGWYVVADERGDPEQVQCPVGEPDPFRRIGWRQRDHGALPKVAARLRPGLEIRQGNHSAYAPGSGVTAGGLVVRHFSWRTAAQYERKIANGYRAYEATNLPDGVGTHWRMFGDPDEPTFSDRVREHFSKWFWIDDPYADSSLIYDPAPV